MMRPNSTFCTWKHQSTIKVVVKFGDGRWNVKLIYLVQAAQEHFIADDQNAVERRQHKVFYPVVLHTATKKIDDATDWKGMKSKNKPQNRFLPFLHYQRGCGANFQSHLIHSENLDPLTAQPLIKLSSPVLHKAARGDHEDTLHDWFPPVGSLFKQGPGQCNTLESLSQTHLIGQNGSRTASSPEAQNKTWRSL